VAADEDEVGVHVERDLLQRLRGVGRQADVVRDDALEALVA